MTVELGPAGPATARYLRRRLPWYAFLYGLLGAQGTFWLWLVAVFACWWTAKPTLQRLQNREPETGVTVARAGAGQSKQWVEVEGLELRLDRRLLLRNPEKLPARLPPVPLLVDPSDEQVVASWTELRALADAAWPTGPESEERHRFQQHVAQNLERLDADEVQQKYVPTIGRCLLLQGPEPPSLSPVGQPRTPPLDYEAMVTARLALVRECVHPGRTVKGVLVEAPPAVVERVRGELGVTVAPLLLQEGREPRDLETYIFAASAITLLFLAAGFRGAMHSA